MLSLWTGYAKSLSLKHSTNATLKTVLKSGNNDKVKKIKIKVMTDAWTNEEIPA